MLKGENIDSVIDARAGESILEVGDIRSRAANAFDPALLDQRLHGRVDGEGTGVPSPH